MGWKWTTEEHVERSIQPSCVVDLSLSDRVAVNCPGNVAYWMKGQWGKRHMRPWTVLSSEATSGNLDPASESSGLKPQLLLGIPFPQSSPLLRLS